jgi:hypothetical protein
MLSSLVLIYSSHLSFRRCCKLARRRSCTGCTLPRLVRLRLAENPIALSIAYTAIAFTRATKRLLIRAALFLWINPFCAALSITG